MNTCVLYTADKYIGEIGVCDEGELVWVEKDKIKDLNIWEVINFFKTPRRK